MFLSFNYGLLSEINIVSQIGAFNLRSHEISTVSSDKKWIRDSIGVSYDGIDNRFEP